MTPQPLTQDLYEIDSAWRAGIASERAGFRQIANPYAGIPASRERHRELKLMGWAFDLGWRESQFLTGQLRSKGAAS